MSELGQQLPLGAHAERVRYAPISRPYLKRPSRADWRRQSSRSPNGDGTGKPVRRVSLVSREFSLCRLLHGERRPLWLARLERRILSGRDALLGHR
jgi:hypothetical protein